MKSVKAPTNGSKASEKAAAKAKKAEAKTAKKTAEKPQSKPNASMDGKGRRAPAVRKSRNEPVMGVQASAATPVLKFVIFIIDWKASRYITEIFEEQNVRFHFICKGRGTASSEILDLLGIGASDKAVIVCLEQDVMTPFLIKEVTIGLGLHNPGAGIAFAIPLSGINKPILQVFKNSVHAHISGKKAAGAKTAIRPEQEEPLSTEKKHDLIVIVVNQGFSDELMAVAKDAGATGGTIVNARGLVHKGPVKFFGISVQDEKEIITILATREKKVAIMHAVSKAFGVSSKAKGIVFSLPAENVTGLSQR
jgi:hypothetical protein